MRVPFVDKHVNSGTSLSRWQQLVNRVKELFNPKLRTAAFRVNGSNPINMCIGHDINITTDAKGNTITISSNHEIADSLVITFNKPDWKK